MAKTVNVWCAQGVTLRLHREHPAPDIGHMVPDPDHMPVTLKAGHNPGVDAAFFAAWIEQNKNLSLVASGGIVASDEEAA